ncbi:MAG: acyl-ACP desaturase [Bdellovibrionota bacterium]
MLIDYRTKLLPEQVKRLDAIKEVLRAIEPEVRVSLENHRRQSRRWFPHEVVPWGAGRDFNEEPWTPGQVSLRPEIVLALETNLLTEDNLPYYHAQIEQMMDRDSVWQEWNRLWTAEEGGHAAAIRDYLYLMRQMDPYEMERNRLMMMEAGFDRTFNDPLEIFAYTAAQELATRISHLRTGQRADEPIVLKILSLIARDENFHFIFYRSVVSAVLERRPDLMLPALMNQLYSFSMPGTGMSNFELRQATIANAGIYGAREHRDQVILPLLSYWKLDQLTGLAPETQKVLDRILKLEKVLDRMVERQERAPRKTD